jgi:hypothetical protein
MRTTQYGIRNTNIVMTKKDKNIGSKGQVIVYKNKVEVRLEHDTVWLNQAEISKLFGTKRPAITKHLANIFESKELKEKSVCSILEHTASPLWGGRIGNKK